MFRAFSFKTIQTFSYSKPTEVVDTNRENTYEKTLEGFNSQGVYMLNVETEYENATQKIILKR